MVCALVTGAGGFIGQHLVRLLVKENFKVRALYRRGKEIPERDGQVEVVRGDIRDSQAMTQATQGVDVVFHLAGKAHSLSEVSQDEELYQVINVTGTQNVWNGAVSGGAKRFVYYSSVKAMGETSRDCSDESHDSLPSTPYGCTKLQAERWVLNAAKNQQIHAVCLRLSMVYGPGNKGNLFSMIAGIDRGFFPSLPSLNNRRSLVHISNVLQASLLAAFNPLANGHSFIVTDSKSYSTNELCDLIRRGLGKKVPKWHVPAFILKTLAIVGDQIGRIRGERFVFDSNALEKLTESAWYSSEKITRELGYCPDVSFEDAVPELLAWYRQVQG